jgi:hypothetical protein
MISPYAFAAQRVRAIKGARAAAALIGRLRQKLAGCVLYRAWPMAAPPSERRPTGCTEVGAVPLQAHGDSISVGDIIIAQPRHIRSACLLHLLRPLVLHICAGERAGQDRKQNPSDGNRAPRPNLPSGFSTNYAMATPLQRVRPACL